MRKTLDVTIRDEGRDYGKTFHIREMSAIQAEDWAYRALLAVAKGGADLGPEILSQGMAGIALIGIKALPHMNFLEAKPLLEEMMACVSIKPNANDPTVIRELVEDDIEEIKTCFKLRKEALDLHMGFSQLGESSKPS